MWVFGANSIGQGIALLANPSKIGLDSISGVELYRLIPVAWILLGLVKQVAHALAARPKPIAVSPSGIDDCSTPGLPARATTP
ncbi:MAG: hypothetical protein K1X79_00370 [Oligoflexia bacterium]|nr:hypothetical protein [Oligoflexia bacterium]